MSIRRLIVVLAVLSMLLAPSTALAGQGGKKGADATTVTTQSTFEPSCSLPESDAEALVILSNYYPGYWWDHTDLTIAVQAHPSATAEQLAAIHGAIATWSAVIAECFDGLITLTDTTATARNPQQGADITVHYVPRAGGVVFGGYAICGARGCPNIIVRSDLPPSLGAEPYDAEYLGWVTLHEIGHALGLGHATNLWESTDLMGYGWPQLGDPVLSQCNIEALAFVFAWAIEGTDPHPPAAGPYQC